MTTKITWTHVDQHVRQQCEHAGMLQLGVTDAEIAYNYLKYVESKADLFQREGEKMEAERDRLKIQVRALEAKPVKVGKTKQRLAALEKAVTELQAPCFICQKPKHPGSPCAVELDGMGRPITREWRLAARAESRGADPFGPRDADGWYTWNGDDTMRPAGRVDVMLRDCEDVHTWDADSIRWKFAKTDPDGDVVKWRPAQ